jgi:hypothetical protein
MNKRIVCIAVCLALSVLAAVPARAQAPVQGPTFALDLTGLPDDLYQCQSVRGAIDISLFANGTTAREPAVVTMWIETPLGRAVLDRQTRGLRPGQSVRVLVAFASPCPVTLVPGPFTTFPVTVGVDVTIKGETLEATHTMTYYNTTAP